MENKLYTVSVCTDCTRWGNLFNFLNRNKYIVAYKSLPKYCNSFMHIQRSLRISDAKWRTKKIDKKDYAIFYNVWAKMILKKRMKMM